MRFSIHFGFVLLLLVMLLPVATQAQIVTDDNGTITAPPAENDEDTKPNKNTQDKIWNWDNVFIGGIPSFAVDNEVIWIAMSAETGYFVHPRVALGTQFTYQFIYDRLYGDKYHIYGGGPFARGYVWEGIFIHAGYEVTSYGPLRVEDSFGNLVGYTRIDVNALLLGGGYHLNYDDGFGFQVSVMYNVLGYDYGLSNLRVSGGITYNFIR